MQCHGNWVVHPEGFCSIFRIMRVNGSFHLFQNDILYHRTTQHDSGTQVCMLQGGETVCRTLSIYQALQRFGGA